MGQGIYYCCRCQIQLRSKDFEQGAVHYNAQAYCGACAPEEARISSGPPPPETSPRKNKSTTRIPIHDPGSSSRRTPTIPEKSSAGPLIALAGVVVVGLVVLLLVAGSGSDRVPAPPPVAEKIVAPRPIVPPVEPPKPSPPAGTALRKARDYVRSNPADFIGQAELYEQALPLDDARRELEAVRKAARERIAAELAALDPRIRESTAKEEFAKALDLIEETRRRLNAPDWQTAVNQRSETVRRQASDLFAAIKKEALENRGRGKALQERVAGWGLEPLATELARALAEPAAVPESKPSTEAVAYAASWEAALQLARGRDYTAALADLKRAADGLQEETLRKKAAEDFETLRQAGALLKELQQIPSKWQKGKTLSVEFIDGAGAVKKAEGAIARMDPHRIEINGEVIPLGEIRLESLADKETRGLALLRRLEGGAESPRDQEARALYHAAEQAYESPASAADSVQKHAMLLKDYAETLFVRRNRAFIQARSQGGREFFLFPEDMTGAGSFKWVKNAKTESCYSSDADTEAARARENVVEIPFSVLPGTEYRCWVYAGGCCAETFAFSYQAADAIVPAKITALGLKKSHSMHTGPKTPARWEWVALPLPKNLQAGPQKLRILTNQEGFSVAYAFISAAKQAPPGDVKAHEKARLETPGVKPLIRSAPPPRPKAASDDQVVVWKLDLDGGNKPATVQQGGVEKAPDRPDRFCVASLVNPNGVNHLYLGDGNGICTFSGDEVLSFEYWVDANVNHIVFNVYNRTLQKNHVSAVPNPVQGKWTRQSVRIADLAEGPIRIGDLVAGIYMHASGGATRKFYVDNVQVLKPRPGK
jgi:hypothetical protein